MFVVKLLFNSTVSTKEARFTTSDEGSNADSARPGDLTVEPESADPGFNAEQMKSV